MPMANLVIRVIWASGNINLIELQGMRTERTTDNGVIEVNDNEWQCISCKIIEK